MPLSRKCPSSVHVQKPDVNAVLQRPGSSFKRLTGGVLGAFHKTQLCLHGFADPSSASTCVQLEPLIGTVLLIVTRISVGQPLTAVGEVMGHRSSFRVIGS